MRTGLSAAIIGFGPLLLAVVTATVLFRRARRRPEGPMDAARIIVAATILATTLVTIGVLIIRR